jgi:ADP-heptose:LPS heptosyltransferase
VSDGEMLVAAPVRWDEACFSVPAVRAMMGAGWSVGVLCEERQRLFWEKIDGLAVEAYPEKAKAKLFAEKVAGRWKGAVIWEPGLGAEIVVRADVARRLGPASKDLRKFLTHPVDVSKPPGPVDHRVKFYLSLVEALGIPVGRPEFYGPAELGVPAVPGTVLLCPDSDFGATYEWPLTRWEELASALLGDGTKLTVAGLAGGRGKGKALAERLGEKARFLEARPLAGALEIFAAHERVVAAESSLPHVAAFAGATCVTLFGPGDPNWRRPLGRRHGIARRHVECAPCFLEKCPMDLRCQDELTVERVLAAIR